MANFPTLMQKLIHLFKKFNKSKVELMKEIYTQAYYNVENNSITTFSMHL